MAFASTRAKRIGTRTQLSTGNSGAARRHKAPSRADGLERGGVERVEAGRIRDFGAFDGTVGAHQHPDSHGALLLAPARERGIGRGRIAGVVGVRGRIGASAGAAIGGAGRPRPTTVQAAVATNSGHMSAGRVAWRRGRLFTP